MTYPYLARWLTRSWWRYILEKPAPSYKIESYWRVVFCRLRGHDDIVFYNPGGLEPDYSCQRCGEDLG